MWSAPFQVKTKEAMSCTPPKTNTCPLKMLVWRWNFLSEMVPSCPDMWIFGRGVYQRWTSLRGHLLLQLPREQRLRVDTSRRRNLRQWWFHFRVRAATDGLIGLLVGVPYVPMGLGTCCYASFLSKNSPTLLGKSGNMNNYLQVPTSNSFQ